MGVLTPRAIRRRPSTEFQVQFSCRPPYLLVPDVGTDALPDRSWPVLAHPLRRAHADPVSFLTNLMLRIGIPCRLRRTARPDNPARVVYSMTGPDRARAPGSRPAELFIGAFMIVLRMVFVRATENRHVRWMSESRLRIGERSIRPANCASATIADSLPAAEPNARVMRARRASLSSDALTPGSPHRAALGILTEASTRHTKPFKALLERLCRSSTTSQNRWADHPSA